MAKAKPSNKATATSKTEEPRHLIVKVYVNEREQTQIRVAAAMSNQAMTEFCRAALIEKSKLALKKVRELDSDDPS